MIGSQLKKVSANQVSAGTTKTNFNPR